MKNKSCLSRGFAVHLKQSGGKGGRWKPHFFETKNIFLYTRIRKQSSFCTLFSRYPLRCTWCWSQTFCHHLLWLSWMESNSTRSLNVMVLFILLHLTLYVISKTVQKHYTRVNWLLWWYGTFFDPFVLVFSILEYCILRILNEIDSNSTCHILSGPRLFQVSLSLICSFYFNAALISI